MLVAALLLGWLAAHTEIFYTDGLRYIAQARTIDAGSLSKGLFHSVDHPVYPLAIVLAHRLSGGEGPSDWQQAAQLAAIFFGVLLVIPLYAIALELFGASRAWLACLFIYLVPFNGHVLADALSESTFLLFWSVGVRWSSLRPACAPRNSSGSCRLWPQQARLAYFDSARRPGDSAFAAGDAFRATVLAVARVPRGPRLERHWDC